MLFFSDSVTQVVDQPHFIPGTEAYSSLTPRRSRAAQLPLVGRILRELSRRDTRYHPGAQANPAAALSGIPGELELYLRFLPGLGGSQVAPAGDFERYH